MAHITVVGAILRLAILRIRAREGCDVGGWCAHAFARVTSPLYPIVSFLPQTLAFTGAGGSRGMQSQLPDVVGAPRGDLYGCSARLALFTRPARTRLGLADGFVES